MVTIGCVTTDERTFRAHAAPTIQILDEGDSLLLRRHGCDSFDDSCNEMLAAAAACEDLEAFVLVHQQAVTTDARRTLATVRQLLTDPEVAIVGAADDGWPREAPEATGALLALSPWAARNLRFDGASVDACVRDISLQARASGRRVLAAPLGIGRAWSSSDPADRRRQLSAMVELRRKWESPC